MQPRPVTSPGKCRVENIKKECVMVKNREDILKKIESYQTEIRQIRDRDCIDLSNLNEKILKDTMVNTYLSRIEALKWVIK